MIEKTYWGLPRKEIEWYPKINYDICISCGGCQEFCPNNVFEKAEDRVVVARPYDCVVGCKACASRCPVGAINFPSRDELMQMLRTLRKKYGYG